MICFVLDHKQHLRSQNGVLQKIYKLLEEKI